MILLFLLWSAVAQGAYEAPPRMLSGGVASFAGQGLGLSCYAFDVAADVLPCNPAFIAKKRERVFNANLFLGNNVSYLNEAMDLTQGRANANTIQNLFQRKQNDEIQAKLEFGYWQETFGWSVSPLQANYSTSFQNQSLPEISLYAAFEESARIQFGSYWGEDWSYGVQLRYVHRRFVGSRFFLTDALASGGDELFRPKEQHLLFVEPGILYAPQNSDWKPEMTLLVANAGLTGQGYEEVPQVPQYHLTGSVNPQNEWGRFSLGVDVHLDKHVQRGLDPFTLGSFYEFGILRIFGSLARQESSAGFGVYHTWWNTGIAYRTENLEDAAGSPYDLRKTYLFLGVEL